MESFQQQHREALAATLLRIYRQRMTTTSGGNLSIRDAAGDIWITPSRVDKGALKPEDIVRVGPDGRAEGLHPASSELPFHREIYRRRPDLRAVVHAHPGALVAFSLRRQAPDTRFHPLIHATCGRVAVAPYACPGTAALGEVIAAAFAGGADCVLLENHGVVVGGRDLAEAFRRFELLEFAAQVLIRAAALGPVRMLTAEQLKAAPPQAFAALPPPSGDDRGLRDELCGFVQRASRQQLVTASTGVFSVRVPEGGLLTTPSGCDRSTVRPEELVRVWNNACTPNLQPSRTARLHVAIYGRHPEVGAVISALPPCAAAFCVTSAPFSTHTIPESYVVLNEVPQLPLLRKAEDEGRIVEALSPVKTPAVMIANEGVVVTGRTLLEAFDRLEVLEATAEALILARPLGPVVPMPEAALAELRRVFNLP